MTRWEPQAFSPDHQQPEEISLHFTPNSILAKNNRHKTIRPSVFNAIPTQTDY